MERQQRSSYFASLEADGGGAVSFREGFYSHSTAFCSDKAAKKRDKLLTNYKRPIDHTNELNAKYAQEKQGEEALKQRVREEVAHALPNASKEKTEAAIFRRMYEKKHLEKEINDPEVGARG